MNASELFEIVMDVPREAWPIYDSEGFHGWLGFTPEIVVNPDDDGDEGRVASWNWRTIAKSGPRNGQEIFWCGCVHADMLFEASMMRQLLTKSLYLVPVYHVKDSPNGKGWQLFGSDLTYKDMWTPSGQTISNGSFIEALAIVCKQLGDVT